MHAQGIHKAAVYCDKDGKKHICSAVCTHMYAAVEWNPLEKTFDWCAPSADPY